jgi:hypothetical protein
MASANKFQDAVEQLGLGTHDLNTDTLKVYASNAAPSASADAVKTDLAEITAENGYPSGGSDTTNGWSETGGTATLVGTDVVWTASTGSFGPLQYIVLYNDTAASDNLLLWWDYGSGVTVLDTETFTVDFGASVATLA